MPNIASPNVIQPSLGSSLANTGFSKPEPGFLESAGGFGGLTSGIRNVTRNLAAGFAKDPAYRQMAAQQLQSEQQMQQQQAAEIQKAVIQASLDSLGQLAESVRGIGSQSLMGSPSTLQMIERAANNVDRALSSAGWPEEQRKQMVEQYKWQVMAAADMQQPNELDQKISAIEKQLGRKLTEDEIKKVGGAYIEPRETGDKAIFQDIIGDGGVKIPGVSYDGGKTFQPMTAERMFGGGQFKGGFEDAVQFVLGQEGGYVEDDAGKGPTNMGINSTANPDVDVENLTTEQAVQVYKERYWDALNLDSLSPAAQLVAFDAAVNQGQDFAAALIRGAGDNPEKMIELRSQAYENLAQRPEYSQYLPSWKKRLNDLSGIVAGGGIDVSRYATPDQEKEKGKLLTPEEAAAEGLPEDRRWQRKPDGTIEQVTGTAAEKPEQKARLLSEGEATALNLPTDRRWQVNPNGEISQVSGTEQPTSKVRLLSSSEAKLMGLPVDRRWQEKPDGTVEQVAGTSPEKAPAQSASEAEIERLTSIGYSREEAINLTSGAYSLSAPDAEGNIVIVNKATGKPVRTINMPSSAGLTEAPAGTEQPATPEQEKSAFIDSLEDEVEWGTGGYARFKEFIGNTAGQLLSGEEFPKTQGATRNIRVFNNAGRKLLAQGLATGSDKLSNQEQFWSEELLPNPDNWLKDPESEAKKISTLRAKMQEQLSFIDKALENPRMTLKQRSSLTDYRNGVSLMLDMMGPPPDQGRDALEAEIDALYAKPSSKWTPEDTKRAEEILKELGSGE